jgi:TonB family protein
MARGGKWGSGQAVVKLIAAVPESADAQLSRWAMAAPLSHPHLVRLFDWGRCELDGIPLLYLVMEFAGENLSQILPHRSLTPAETQQMLPPVLEALAYIHGHAYVHGHLQPSNILVVDDQIKLSVDGMCKAGETTGNQDGSSPYTAPESSRGGLTRAADVWALGVTLTESLTQRLPHLPQTGPHAEPVIPPMPPPFADIARHCLDPLPERRWTVDSIAAPLGPLPPLNNARIETSMSRSRSALWRYVVAAVVAGLALGAVLLGPRLINGPFDAQQASAAAKQAAIPEAKENVPVAIADHTAPPPGAESQGPGNRPALPASLREEPSTNTSPASRAVSAVVHQVMPDVPQKAQDTIRGTVRVSVRVAVDGSGNVTEARLESPGPSRYFANLAMTAARDWKFAPASLKRPAPASEWILRFEFERNGTRASAQSTP